jgi:hypothetical protein
MNPEIYYKLLQFKLTYPFCIKFGCKYDYFLIIYVFNVEKNKLCFDFGKKRIIRTTNQIFFEAAVGVFLPKKLYNIRGVNTSKFCCTEISTEMQVMHPP